MIMYGVVTMDLVKSRNIQNREAVQEMLEEYIETINKKYNNILPSPIRLLLGDEWQLITDCPSECYNIVHEFQKLLWPLNLDLYAGIGIGKLGTKISEDTRKMDGECFLLAREAIDIAKGKDTHRRKYIHSKYNRVFLKSGLTLPDNERVDCALDEVALSSIGNDYLLTSQDLLNFDIIINALIENTEILKSKMTEAQTKTYLKYLKVGSYRKMNIDGENESIGNISQKLNSANYFTIQYNHGLIKHFLEHAALLLADKYSRETIES